nr:MAG TPA: minor tail protein [Caudoviricetes sp.]
MADGKVIIDTELDNSGFKQGLSGLKSQCNGLKSVISSIGKTVAVAFSVVAIINFGRESVKAASDLSNAMLGLQSIMDGQGRSFSQAQSFIEDYIKDGLVPMQDAVTAYKNLAMRGYDTTQIEQTMTALKDAATFGRQSSLTMGQAISSATEGLKNENSILVDNAGVTKNVSVMWKEYAQSIGVGVQSLTKEQKIQAEVNGILQETKFQTGDAAKAVNTYAGQMSMLSFNFQQLKVAVGNTIIPVVQAVLPAINTIISALTSVANLIAQITTALFGKSTKSAQKATAATNSAANAQNSLADSTKKANKESDKQLAAFDELNILKKDSTDSSSGTSGSVANSGGTVAETPILAGEIGSEVTVSPKVQQAVDFIRGLFEGIKQTITDVADYVRTNFVSPFIEAVNMVAPQVERFKSILSGIWSDISDLTEPLKVWFTNDFTPFLQNYILTWGHIVSGLFDSFNMVFQDIWSLVIQPILDKFTTTVLPFWTEFANQIVLTLGPAFDFIKAIFDAIWQDVIAPCLDFIIQAWCDLWDIVKKLWDEYGEPIFDALREAINGTKDTFLNVWSTIIKPVFDNIFQVLQKLWDEHLKPLIAQIGEFVAKLVQGALEIYNKFILPIVNWFVKNLGPPIVQVINSITSTIGTITGVIADVAKNIFKSLGGVVDFITGIFTGNWEKAWNGIKDIFSGIWDSFVSIVRVPINGIIGLINKMIDAINGMIHNVNKLHVDVPDFFGGGTFGFNIPIIPNIPKLAQGAVIPPNREFMAVLGDQKSGTNLEAPADLIRQIVREELESLDMQPQVVVKATGSIGALIRLLNLQIDRANKRYNPVG